MTITSHDPFPFARLRKRFVDGVYVGIVNELNELVDFNPNQRTGSLASLRALTAPEIATMVMVEGAASSDDGGGGLFVWNAGSSTADNGATVIAPDGGGAGRWKRVYSGPVDLAWFSTGTDTAKIQAAITLAGGEEEILLSGDRSTTVNGATMLQTAAKTVLRGNPQALLTVQEASTTGTSFIVDMGADGLTLADVNIDVTKAQVGLSTMIFVQPEYDDTTLRNVSIDGNTALVSTVQDRSIQIVKGSTVAGIEGVRIDSSRFEAVARVYTRDNSNTVDHKRIKATFNTHTNAWRTVYTFNAPGVGGSGYIDDVLVIGDTFDTHAGIVQGDTAMSGNNNAVGMVGVRGGRVIGCHVAGKFGALWHVEENAFCGVAAANTARMANEASTSGVIEWLANNVSGSTVVPQYQVAVANALQSTDGVGKGMYLQSQASGDAAQWSIVGFNVFADYDEAYRTDTDARTVLAMGNVLKGATNAAELTRASLLFMHNLVAASAETIHVSRGGLLGPVHYANLSSATAGVTSWGASAAGPIALTEWTWETGLFTIAAGVSNYNIGPMPTRMRGQISLAMSVSAAIFRNMQSLITWDGATLAPASTGASDFYYGSGSIAMRPVNNGGQLAIEFNNGGADTANARLQVRFHSGQFII